MSVCLLTVSLFLYERRRGWGGMYVPRPQFRILQRCIRDCLSEFRGRGPLPVCYDLPPELGILQGDGGAKLLIFGLDFKLEVCDGFLHFIL